MTRTEYEKLKSSGMMWEFHPEFTGVYEEDIPQRSNPMSDQDRVEFEAWANSRCPVHMQRANQLRSLLEESWLAARKGTIPTADVMALCEAVEKLPELVEDEIRNFTMSHCNADGDHLRMFDLMPDGHEEETIDDIVDQVCGAVVDAIRAARPRGLWKWAGAQTW